MRKTESIEYLMAERFDHRPGVLFYRDGCLLVLSYPVLYWFVVPIPVYVLGLAFVLYGAIVMGASNRGPYRIAVQVRDVWSGLKY